MQLYNVQDISARVNQLAEKIASMNTAFSNMTASGNQGKDFRNVMSQAVATNVSFSSGASFGKNITSTLKDVGVSSQSSANDTYKTSQTSANSQKATTDNTYKSNTKSDETNNKTESTDSSKDNTKTQNTDSASKTETSTDNKTDTKEKVTTLQSDEKNVIRETLEEAGQNLVEAIAEELDISIEDIEKAMEVLGLNFVNILNPENITGLIAEVSGDEGVVAIVTDSDLYSSLSNLTDTLTTMQKNVMNQLGVSQEEIGAAIDMGQEENFEETMGQNLEEIPNPEAMVEVNPEEKNPEHININLAERADPFKFDILADKKVETSELINSDAPENIDIDLRAFAENQTSNNSGNQNFNMFGGQSQSNQMSWTDFLGNIAFNIQSIETMTEELTSAVTSAESAFDAEDVMNQINEYIKLSVKPEMTSMELQLHPHSLGNLNIMIETAKEGNVVAKFLTADENVKAVIESQLAQLIQKLDEQGVKVNSIEVAVQTHQFEQNLEQDNDRRKSEESQKNKTVKPLRRINLEELTFEETEALAAEDRLHAQMMEANGGTVDYSA
ncbi:MAG: flagellar hook-length control protein FliK [Butyrivibrio sp.]|nr:flagellar hook-length control protein FliK [Butyrivibrio sp.]